MPPTELSQKIESRTATVSIVGLGYVGLPLAVASAEAGFSVVCIELESVSNSPVGPMRVINPQSK